ncbi:carbohydrate ABC transporter substrate-binding protein (CUT1 family) [Halanaerobium saccharolyticum]|uniref:Carbohydrate ABC transporter substrate-binding protein (CUT1 family) n=1 Tax=Halanaerobium saccharolyticum TaxID=43595 RepID=A0A4R6LZ25_9FIRM|nr:sugar ABC transporter substrate-binding protein [Halanaerobium saccharolyticum]TDO94044.1 carbohydrate ABC transporter substrate-binding protein (CUT1 family) [Halanaerobium saccharolyticum]
MQKRSVLLITLISLLLVLSIPTAVVAQTTVDVWHYFAPGTNALRWAVDEWNGSHEDVKINHRYIPFADFKREVTKAITTNTVPDIIFVDNPDHAQYAAMGALADITEYVEEWGQADKYFDGPWNSTMYEGKNYGIPQNSNTIVLFYNKDMVEAAGLEGPPETWADFREYAEKLTSKEDNVRGLSMCLRKAEDGVFQFLPFLQMGGGDIYNLDAPEAAAGLKMLSDMYQNGWVTPESINFDQSSAMGVFASQNSAMTITGPWDLSQLKDVDFNWDVALLPYKEDVGIRASALGGENFAIMKGADNVEEAWEFIRWTQRRDFVEQMYIKGGRLPSRSDVAEESDYWRDDPVQRTFLEQLEYAKARGPHPKWPQISNELQLAMQKALTGQAAPEEALAEAAANIESILE